MQVRFSYLQMQNFDEGSITHLGSVLVQNSQGVFLSKISTSHRAANATQNFIFRVAQAGVDLLVSFIFLYCFICSALHHTATVSP